jgi:hypothetical protein
MIDAEGFVAVADRLSKIGGEMAPRVRVEDALRDAAASAGRLAVPFDGVRKALPASEFPKLKGIAAPAGGPSIGG